MKRYFQTLLSLIRQPFLVVLFPARYGIKRGYIHRKNYTYYDNTAMTDEFQSEVYQAVLSLAEKEALHKIIDFGCGSAYKLLKYFGEYELAGVDVKETVGVLREKHPGHKWLAVEDLKDTKLEGDLIICADVIEHVPDPLELIQHIKDISNVQYVVFSTPERDLLNGREHFGPPVNKHHIREWTGWEFNKFLSEHFTILSHSITNFEQATQMLVCKPKA